MGSEAHQPVREVWKGLGLLVLLHVIGQLILGFTGRFLPILGFNRGFLSPFPLMFVGVTQLVYVIPAILCFKRKGRLGIVTGLIIGASLTFLLNATCFGAFMIYARTHRIAG